MHLDAFTLTFVGFLISIGESIALTLLLMVLRGQAAMRWWTAGLWISTLGLVLVALRGPIPDSVSILLGNGMLAMWNVLLLKGLSVHLHRPFPWTPALLVVAAFVSLLAWFAFVHPDLRLRLRLFSAQSILWDGWASLILLRHAGRDLRLSSRLALIILLADIASNLLRIALPLNGNGPNPFDRANSIVVLSYTAGLMLSLALMLAQIMLVTERINADLRRLARTDGLTGLLNRNALELLAGPTLRRCQSSGRPFSVLMLDLDYFKRINDTWGHEAGDQVLRHIARLLQAPLGSTETLVGRYGGEEFLLTLTDAAPGQASAIAGLIRQRLRDAPVNVNGERIEVTASIGLATAGPDEDFHHLVTRADNALYQAKDHGRDCIREAAAAYAVA